ncbi:MAG TPA: dethiobiotin synthase [Nevskiaceae bacterium]|nr:dethiobiotin synthase [Nevskiaceae bacterium]
MSTPRRLFITGTDTGVGKTWVTVRLLEAARERGLPACGYKPIASGAERHGQGWANEDALALQAVSWGSPGYEQVNPLLLREAVAPHLAARSEGQVIDTARLSAGLERLPAGHALCLIEGAGGWLTPLDERRSYADWVVEQGWPVVLVVALRLGCLNHAQLSVAAIQARAPLVGWIANLPDPTMPRWAENLDDLRQRLPVPLLGAFTDGAPAPVAATVLARLLDDPRPASDRR